MAALLLIIPGEVAVFSASPKTILLSKVYQLTRTSYPEVHPRIITDEKGNVGVFWLSLKFRTPQIEGGWLKGDKLVRVRERYSCVGRWDIAAEGRGNLWLVRSHWGTLYVHRLRNLAQVKEWVIVRGRAGDPCLELIEGKPFLLWRQGIAPEKEELRAGFLRTGKWQIRSLISDRRVRFPRIEKNEKETLILAQIEEDERWYILTGKMKDFLLAQVSLQKLPFSLSSWRKVSGIIDSAGRCWVSWRSGEKGEEKIFISSSFDRKKWSTPFSLYPLRGRVTNPQMREWGDFIYIFYQLWDEARKEWLIRGTKLLKADYTKREIVEFSPLLKGEEFDTILLDDTMWIVWQSEGEIYLGKGAN